MGVVGGMEKGNMKKWRVTRRPEGMGAGGGGVEGKCEGRGWGGTNGKAQGRKTGRLGS